MEKSNSSVADGPYRVGAGYLVRTVTHYYTGRLVAVYPLELVFDRAAWIADTGRWTQAVATGSLNEVEPYPPEKLVVVGRGALVDAVEVDWELPKAQK